MRSLGCVYVFYQMCKRDNLPKYLMASFVPSPTLSHFFQVIIVIDPFKLIVKCFDYELLIQRGFPSNNN